MPPTFMALVVCVHKGGADDDDNNTVRNAILSVGRRD